MCPTLDPSIPIIDFKVRRDHIGAFVPSCALSLCQQRATGAAVLFLSWDVITAVKAAYVRGHFAI